jgi:flavin reductase (DIM6/NTAB) family NADH-FMN oxidoreductase RutF
LPGTTEEQDARQKTLENSVCFAIDGTVAHLQCRILQKQETNLIDDDHYFVVAKIVKACVLSSHWDERKKTFGPVTQKDSPTLAFFGSQTFGYVVPKQLRNNADTSTRQRQNSSDTEPWIRLTEGKQFSRLLYTNPVCLLKIGGVSKSTTESEIIFLSMSSWLTATNNEGSFMSSIKRWKKDSDMSLLLKKEAKFTVLVPSDEMEHFLQHLEEHGDEAIVNTNNLEAQSVTITNLDEGGSDHCLDSKHDNTLKGTVAKLECIIKGYDSSIDKDHFLIFAQVESAAVHSAYWDEKKNLFRPAAGYSPYLKYLGRQACAYVVPD